MSIVNEFFDNKLRSDKLRYNVYHVVFHMIREYEHKLDEINKEMGMNFIIFNKTDVNHNLNLDQMFDRCRRLEQTYNDYHQQKNKY